MNDASLALNQLRSEIAAAVKIARRKTEDIALIAVSKTCGVDKIRPMLLAGHRIFGENRVQEAEAKWPKLRVEYPDVRLHFIGQLQSNKANEAVALFDTIHTLDRMSLVQALGKAMRQSGRIVSCFVQVNVGAEEQKGGCAIDDLPMLLSAANDVGVPVVGLMCIPPADIEPAPFFALLAELAARNGLENLSMGMSGDFATAIMLGATHVRIGTALFGGRPE